MTAPLPAASPLAIAVAPRHGPKAAKAEALGPDAFELPEPPADKAPDQPAGAVSEADQPAPDMAAILLAAAPAEIPPPAAPPTAIPTEPLPPTQTISNTTQPAPLAQADVPPEARQPAAAPSVPPASHQRPEARETRTEPQTARLSQSAVQPPASQKYALAEPSRQSPALQPSPQPVPGESSAESREQSASRDQRGGAPRAIVPRADAPSMPPFRMEALALAPQAMPAAAVLEAPPASTTPPAPTTHDLAADTTAHTPDVVVELAAGDALDVTISAATPDSLERLTAAEPDLRRALTQLGAEVEAIRMELRPEPGAERNSPDRADRPDQPGDHSTQTTQDNNGRQGDRMTRHTEPQETRQGRLALRLIATPDAAQATPPASGRIDRYA